MTEHRIPPPRYIIVIRVELFLLFLHYRHPLTIPLSRIMSSVEILKRIVTPPDRDRWPGSWRHVLKPADIPQLSRHITSLVVDGGEGIHLDHGIIVDSFKCPARVEKTVLEQPEAALLYDVERATAGVAAAFSYNGRATTAGVGATFCLAGFSVRAGS